MKTSLIARQWWIVGQKWPSERLQTTVYGRATPRNVNLKKETIEERAAAIAELPTVKQWSDCDGRPITHLITGRFVFRRTLMKREICLLAVPVFLLGAVASICAQNLPSRPSPTPPSDILGPQLIAWSQMQKPEPVPQPLPPPDKPVQQPAPTTNQQPAPPAKSQVQPRPPAAQTFTGTVVKDAGRYILKVSGTTVYQLDDQDKAKQYEGKQVKIEGTLDANGNSLHITSIELLS
ncbi:MAG: DUF5818 domain-containing protein [Candidatus Sulfotelmatobacter sp.]